MTFPPLRFEYAASPASIADPSLSGSWTWHEASGVVSMANGPSWSRGRKDERDNVGPGTCTWPVDDTTGAWAPDGSGSVRIGTPIRVRYALVTGNMVTNSTLETDATGWSGLGSPTPTVARSTAQHWQGSASLLVTWGTSAAFVQDAAYLVTGLVVGRSYTVSAYLRVPAGSPKAYVGIFFVASSASTTTNDAWERVSVAFTATSASHYVVVGHSQAASAGNTCYVDGVMVEEGTSASAFTTTAPSYPVLWDGFVSGLQSSWRNGIEPLTTVRAVDLMGWLARQETSAPQAASAGIEALDPVAWWPCDDPSGCRSLRQAGSGAIGVLVGTRTGGTGGTMRTLADGLPAVTLDPASETVGYRLSTAAAATVTCGSDRTYAAHLRCAKRPASGTVVSVAGWSDGTTWVTLLVKDDGRLYIETSRTSTGSNRWGPFADVSDGRWHHAAIVLEPVTGGAGLTLYVDGEASSPESGWSSATVVADAQTGLARAIASGGGGGHSVWAGDLAHVAVFDAALTQAQVRSVAGPLCTAGLDAGQAITALLAPTGVIPSTTGTFAAVLGQLDGGRSMMASVVAAASAERGIVHARPGAGLEVQARSVRRSPSAAITLLASDVDIAFAPQSDEQSVVNDVTVTGQASASARRVDETSLGTYGRRAASVSLPLRDAASCDDHAAWMATSQSTPAVRIGAATIAATVKAATVSTATLLGLDLSDQVDITGLPGTPSSLSLFVEGVAMRAGLSGLDVTLNLSPATSPDLIDYASEGSLLSWWDARYPAGIGVVVPDETLIRTLEDLASTRDATAAGSVNLLWAGLSNHETAYDEYTWPGYWWDQWNGYPSWSGVSRSSATAHSGTYSMACSWSSSSKAYLTGVGIWPLDPPTVCKTTPGAPVTVSAYVSRGSGAKVALGDQTSHGSASTASTGVWERLSWQTYALTGMDMHQTTLAGYVPLGLCPAEDGAGLCYVDDVMVEEGHVTPGTFNNDPASNLRPTLRYGGPGGSPMIETSLVGHVLPLASALTDTAPCTVYAVVRPDALDKWLLADSSTSGQLGLMSSAGGAKWLLRYKSAGDAIYSDEIASPVGSSCVLTVQIAAGGTIAFRHNGTAVGGGTDAGILGLDFNRLVGTNAAPWSGGIGAILVYGDAHSAATVARIERALALMWGVRLA